MSDKLIRSGFHWEFGWLRRKEMDDHNGYCYEDPNGDLMFFQELADRKVVFLDVWESKDTGEKYLARSKRVPVRTEMDRATKIMRKAYPKVQK